MSEPRERVGKEAAVEYGAYISEREKKRRDGISDSGHLLQFNKSSIYTGIKELQKRLTKLQKGLLSLILPLWYSTVGDRCLYNNITNLQMSTT